MIQTEVTSATLSDGSVVFAVELTSDEGGAALSVPCINQENAELCAAAIRSALASYAL